MARGGVDVAGCLQLAACFCDEGGVAALDGVSRRVRLAVGDDARWRARLVARGVAGPFEPVVRWRGSWRARPNTGQQ